MALLAVEVEGLDNADFGTSRRESHLANGEGA